MTGPCLSQSLFLCRRFKCWLTIFHQRGRWLTISVDHSAGSSVSPHKSLTYPTSILQCVVYVLGCSNVHSPHSLLPNFPCRFSGECKARVSHSSASINFIPTFCCLFHSLPLPISVFQVTEVEIDIRRPARRPLHRPSSPSPSPLLPSLPLHPSPTQPQHGSEGS